MSVVSLFSSLEHYLYENPEAKVSYPLVDHELQHLRKRENLSQIISLAATIFAVLSAVVGVFGGHAFIVGTFCTIALLTWGYAYGCRLAEISLRDRLSHWMVGGGEQTKEEEPWISANPTSVGRRISETFHYFFK